MRRTCHSNVIDADLTLPPPEPIQQVTGDLRTSVVQISFFADVFCEAVQLVLASAAYQQLPIADSDCGIEIDVAAIKNDLVAGQKGVALE